MAETTELPGTVDLPGDVVVSGVMRPGYEKMLTPEAISWRVASA